MTRQDYLNLGLDIGKDYPYCTPQILGMEFHPEICDEKDAQFITDYFKQFLPPLYHPKLTEDFIEWSRVIQPCVLCARPQGGAFAHWHWTDNQAGEGKCWNCGWPGRVKHIIQQPDENVPLTVIGLCFLQFHPEYVHERGGLNVH